MKFYMVQTYWYSTRHLDNIFPSLSKETADNYIHHLAMSYEDEGSEYIWDNNALLLLAHGELINATETAELEFNKEID
jgi:hypothetical protein